MNQLWISSYYAGQLSIVTLAAVQGYTGSLVDERTVDAR